MLEMTVRKSIYFSDAQRRIQKTKEFHESYIHMQDFKVPAEWHFFDNLHGKGPCDGVGGTVKRLATRASLQSQSTIKYKHHNNFMIGAKDAITSVEFRYVQTSDIESEELLLRDRLEAAEDNCGNTYISCISTLKTTRNALLGETILKCTDMLP